MLHLKIFKVYINCLRTIDILTKREFPSDLFFYFALALFRSTFVPILIYGHEYWLMTERVRFGTGGQNETLAKSQEFIPT